MRTPSSLSAAIYASVRADLLLEIQEAVLAMTGRIEFIAAIRWQSGFEACGNGSANCL
jgi:hypothetical protein